MNDDAISEILSSAEKSALLSMSLHQLLRDAGHDALAKLAWVIYLGSSHSAAVLAEHLGVEPLV